MPNGTKGDHPITDILFHDIHPYPPDVEKALLEVHALNPSIVDFLDFYEWSADDDWQSALKECDEMIHGYRSRGTEYLRTIVEREQHPVAKHNLEHLLYMIEHPNKRMYYGTKDGPRGCLLSMLDRLF